MMEENLLLRKAHEICTIFENELKSQASSIYRIISHIEAGQNSRKLIQHTIQKDFSIREKNQLKNEVEIILKNNKKIKGYHGFELWNILDFYVLELHIFLEGDLKIALVHKYTDELEQELRKKYRKL